MDENNPQDMCQRLLATFSTFSEKRMFDSFRRTNHANENLKDMAQLEMPEDDDDGDAVVTNKNGDIDKGGIGGELKELSTWKIVVLGGVLGYVALNWRDWMEYFSQ